MRRIVETGLTKPPAPHSWAIAANRTLYSVHVPIGPDGTIEQGDASRQAEVAMEDLKATLEATGAGLDDVMFVQIFLTSLDHKAAVDKVYTGYFNEPLPVRACVAVSALPTPGTVIEILATSVAPN